MFTLSEKCFRYGGKRLYLISGIDRKKPKCKLLSKTSDGLMIAPYNIFGKTTFATESEKVTDYISITTEFPKELLNYFATCRLFTIPDEMTIDKWYSNYTWDNGRLIFSDAIKFYELVHYEEKTDTLSFNTERQLECKLKAYQPGNLPSYYIKSLKIIKSTQDFHQRDKDFINLILDCIEGDSEVAIRSVASITSNYSIGTMGIPIIDKVIFKAPLTIVYWSDGSNTKVRAANNDAFSEDVGLAMAITKKYFENQNPDCPRKLFKDILAKAKTVTDKPKKKKENR